MLFESGQANPSFAPPQLAGCLRSWAIAGLGFLKTRDCRTPDVPAHRPRPPLPPYFEGSRSPGCAHRLTSGSRVPDGPPFDLESPPVRKVRREVPRQAQGGNRRALFVERNLSDVSPAY